MNKRYAGPAWILVLAGIFAGIIAGYGSEPAPLSKLRLVQSMLGPLVDWLGPNGAIAAIIGIGLTGTALTWPRKAKNQTETASQPAPRTSPGMPSASPKPGSVPASMPAVSKRSQTLANAALIESPPASIPADPESIARAMRRPIVFGQTFPSPAQKGLSFYGGRPVVPSSFTWPCAANDSTRPLHFLMQWDCTVLAVQDPTGLLPKDGVLYCFLDLAWGEGLPCSFVHLPGPADGWRELDPPAALGPLHGKEGAWQIPVCTSKVDDPDRFVPRLLPQWPFKPLAIDYPAPPPSDNPDDTDEGRFWNDSVMGEALLKAQRDLGGSTSKSEPDRSRPFERPYPAFPQDWAAARIVAAKAIEECRSPLWIRLSKDLGEEERAAREARVAEWSEQARELFLFAAGHPLSERLSAELREDIWSWITEIEPIIGLGFDGLVTQTVDTSLGLSSKGVVGIPPTWIARCSSRHALAIEYMRDEHPDWTQPDAAKRHEERKQQGLLKQVRQIHAPTPNRMFGPPSFVQGDADELLSDHLLLLEFSSNDALGMHLGDGVVQFLIKPHDLRSRRFDRVEVVASSY